MNLSSARRHFQPDPPALRLEAALQLLQQAGHQPPPGAPGSQAWLQGLVDALCELSSRDALTGLANRRGFDAALLRELDRVARSGEPALLLMLDIDDFSRVNQRHGHAVGDQALGAVAQVLARQLRPMDLAARVEGQVFAAILPNCAPGFGHALAETVREHIEALCLPVTGERPLGITVSVGGAYAPPWMRSSPEVWLRRAELQLDRAKSEGGNRACLEPTPMSTVTADEKSLLFSLPGGGDPA